MSLLALFPLPQAHTRMVAFQSSGFVQLAENHVQFQYHYVYINHISSASFAFSVEVRRRKRAGNTMSCYVSGHDLGQTICILILSNIALRCIEICMLLMVINPR